VLLFDTRWCRFVSHGYPSILNHLRAVKEKPRSISILV
jgi:hypothetical protein